MRPASLLLAQAYKSNGEFCEAGVLWNWKNLSCIGVKGGDEINCFSTRGLFMTVGDLQKIGGFYPRALPHYLSDYEFTVRAHRKGFAMISDANVSLRYFEALTGIRSTEGLSIWKTLKTNLSTRSSSNPFHWTTFVLLASPRRYMISNLIRVWWRYFTPIHDTFLLPLRRTLWAARRLLGRAKRKLKRDWLGQSEGDVRTGK
jgi:GT2 family glycosyltransferase